MKKLLTALAVGSMLFLGGTAYAQTYSFSYAFGVTGDVPPTFSDTTIVTGNLVGGVQDPLIRTQFSGSLLDSGSDGASFDNGGVSIQSVQFSADGGTTWIDALTGGLGSAVSVASGGNPPATFAETSGASYISSGLAGTFNTVRLVLNGNLSAADQLGLVGRIDVQAVPEPGTWALMLAGLLVVGSIVRKRVL
jgi:hypothetical protein